MNEWVCHGQEGYTSDFFYAYSTLFKNLKVLLSFFKFQISILWELNVAPTQLHPNSWAFMQVFSAVCTALALRPTLGAFLHFFCVNPHPNKPWVSLSSIPERQLFTLFITSYKDFKGNFVKVVILKTGSPNIYFLNSQPRFPFYWIDSPKKGTS